MKNVYLNKYVILALFAMILCLNNISAQTLHAIIFADTTDPSVGDGDRNDYINMSMEFSTIAAATGMQLKTYYFKDERCSCQNLIDLLSTLQTQSQDVIFFYYTGHGTRSYHDDSQFPQMCLASHYDSQFYPLEKTLSKLTALPSRLKIVFGDCCNNAIAGVTPKDYSSKGATVLTKEPVNTYRSLFSKLSGTIIASGSQVGQTSLTMSFDGRPSGVFTKNFLDVLQDVAKNGLDVAWDEIMANTQDKTQQMTKPYGEHIPVFVIKVKEFKEEDLKNDVAPQNSAVITDEQQQQMGNTSSLQTNITQQQTSTSVPSAIEVLTYMANEKYDINKRIALMPKALKTYFASPNTKVEVVGRNGITIVATEKAEDFLLRLSTAHRLINLVEVDSKTDDQGRYTYLRVHEIYSGY